MTARRIVVQVRPRTCVPTWWPRVGGRLRWATITDDGYLTGLHAEYSVPEGVEAEVVKRFRGEQDQRRWSFRIVVPKRVIA